MASSSNNQSKNYYSSFDFLRFLFMSFICIWHMAGTLNYMKSCHVLADFFFILSGLLLYKSFLTHPNTGVIDYTLKKYNRFAIEWVIVLICTYIMFKWKVFISGDFQGIFASTLRFLSEALLLQDIGIFPRGEIPPGWYLSVLLWGGALIYSALRWSTQFCLKIAFPLLVLFYYSHIFSQDILAEIQRWTFSGLVYEPLWRGITDMCFGILLYHIFMNKRDILEVRYLNYINVASIVSIIFFVVPLFTPMHYDVYALIFYPFLFLGCLCRHSLINRCFANSIWKKVGSLALEMYIVHMLFRGIIIHFNFSQYGNEAFVTILYLAMVILGAILLKRIDTYIRLRFHLYHS